jgi:hypothetical protein
VEWRTSSSSAGGLGSACVQARTVSLPTILPEYTPSEPAPPFEGSAGKTGWFRRMAGTANYWQQLAKSKRWWDEDEFERLSRRFKAKPEELAKFCVSMNEMPEIPAWVDEEGVSAQLLFIVSGKFNVSPKILFVVKGLLIDQVRRYGNVWFAEGQISAKLHGYAWEVARKFREHFPVKSLLIIAYHAKIDISENLRDLADFLGANNRLHQATIRPEDVHDITAMEIEEQSHEWHYLKALSRARSLLRSELNTIEAEMGGGAPVADFPRDVPGEAISGVVNVLLPDQVPFFPRAWKIAAAREEAARLVSEWRQWPRDAGRPAKAPHPPHITYQNGLAFATSSYSAYDGNGELRENMACVSVTVVTC